MEPPAVCSGSRTRQGMLQGISGCHQTKFSHHDTMNERLKWKAVHTEKGRKKYKSINNQLRRATDKAREIWWKEQCDEMEKLDK